MNLFVVSVVCVCGVCMLYIIIIIIIMIYMFGLLFMPILAYCFWGEEGEPRRGVDALSHAFVPHNHLLSSKGTLTLTTTP